MGHLRKALLLRDPVESALGSLDSELPTNRHVRKWRNTELEVRARSSIPPTIGKIAAQTKNVVPPALTLTSVNDLQRSPKRNRNHSQTEIDTTPFDLFEIP